MQCLIELESRRIVEAEMSSIVATLAANGCGAEVSRCPITAHLFKSKIYLILGHTNRT